MARRILVISIGFSVSFVSLMLFLWYHTKQEMEELKAEPVIDKVSGISGQPQRFKKYEDSPHSKGGYNRENSDAATTDATRLEVATPDTINPVATPNETNNPVFEAEDEEFEAQWNELEEHVRKMTGKSIVELAEERLTDMRVKVEESVAQIEPLFEDLAFYEAKLKQLDREAEEADGRERQRKLAAWTVAWRDYRQVENKLNESYIFLNFLSDSEDGVNQFGHLFLSTPEYSKLKSFGEDLNIRQENGIVYPSSMSSMFRK